MTSINQTGVYAGQYWRYNLDSRSVTAGGGGATVQLAAGLDRSSFTPENWYYDGASLCFVPPLNVYWRWQLMSDHAMHLFEIDPSTTPWSLRPTPSVAGRVPQPHPNLMRKMVYLPSFSAVLLVDQASKDVSVYKF